MQLSRARGIDNYKPTQNHYLDGKGLTHLELMLDNSQNDRNQYVISAKVIKENRDAKISSTKHLDDEKTCRWGKETFFITITIALWQTQAQ